MSRRQRELNGNRVGALVVAGIDFVVLMMCILIDAFTAIDFLFVLYVVLMLFIFGALVFSTEMEKKLDRIQKNSRRIY